MSASIPTISSIQRTNLLLAAAAALFLGLFGSLPSAIGCVLGAGLVIANLYILASLGRAVLAASGGGAMAHRAGVLAIPLKLLLIVALVWMLFKRVHVDPLGFGAGVLTQLAAILIETWRAARTASAPALGG
jgi:hypothetical protein